MTVLTPQNDPNLGLYGPKLGEVTIFAGSHVPTGWKLVDSQTLSIAEYQQAYEVFGGKVSDTLFTLPSRPKVNDSSSYYIYMGET